MALRPCFADLALCVARDHAWLHAMSEHSTHATPTLVTGAQQPGVHTRTRERRVTTHACAHVPVHLSARRMESHEAWLNLIQVGCANPSQTLLARSPQSCGGFRLHPEGAPARYTDVVLRRRTPKKSREWPSGRLLWHPHVTNMLYHTHDDDFSARRLACHGRQVEKGNAGCHRSAKALLSNVDNFVWYDRFRFRLLERHLACAALLGIHRGRPWTRDRVVHQRFA